MKNKKRFYNIIINLGLFLMMIGVMLSLFYPTESSLDETYFDIFDYPIIITLIYLVFVIPLLEELLFRGWIIGRKVMYIISILGISTYIYVIYESLVLAISFGFIFMVVEIFTKEDKVDNKVVFYLIATSLLFALSHIHHFSSFFDKSIYFIQFFGLSIMLTAVGLKYGFIYNYLAHVVFNILVTVQLHFAYSNENPHFFENDVYSAKIENMGVIYFGNNNTIRDDNQIINFGYLPQIAVDYLGYKNNEYYETSMRQPIIHKLTINIKDTLAFEKDQFIKDLINESLLRADTTEKDCYIISVYDSTQLHYNPKSDYYLTTIPGLISTIQSENNILLKLDEEIFFRNIIRMRMDFLQQNYSLSERKEILQMYGIVISDSIMDSKYCISFNMNNHNQISILK